MSDLDSQGRQLGAYTLNSISWRIARLEKGGVVLVPYDKASDRSACHKAVATVQKVKVRAEYTVKIFTAWNARDEDSFRLLKVERVK